MFGSTTPRLWTKPLVEGPPGPCGCGCALTPATSLGFSVVNFARDVIGFDPLPWQRWLFIHALELKPDGRFRFRTVLILVARQNGKTSLVEIKNIWKMYVLGAQVLGTAQDLDISEESWDNAVEICEGIPELAVEIKDVVRVNGKKSLKLANGARWKVKAANRKGGRGLPEDDVNLDELREHKSWHPWGAVTKTTMARKNAQIWAFTNAGDDDSIVLNNIQGKARLTVTNPQSNIQMGLFEWSVPDDVRCTCKRVEPDPHVSTCQLADPNLWVMANPSFGYTITFEAMLDALNTDPDEIFLTECLCQRVLNLGGGVLDSVLWKACADPKSLADGRVGIGVDASPKLKSACISLTGIRADGKRHWQVLRHDAGSAWTIPHLKQLRDVDKLEFGPIAIDPSSPAGALIQDIRDAGFEVLEVPGQKLVQAWGAFSKAVDELDGRHMDQDTLNQAITDARNAPSGDVEKFSRKKSSGDITPLVSVTLSDHALRMSPAASTPWAIRS